MISMGHGSPADASSRRRFLKQWQRETGIRFVTGLSRVMGSLPYALVLPGCAGLGLLGCVLCARDRRRVLRNLARAFPQAGRRARVELAGQVFVGMALNAMDGMRFLHRPVAELESLVDVRGGEYLMQAVESGRGAIVVTGHLGPWELFAAYFARFFPLSVVARPAKDARLEELLSRLRARFGVRVVREGDGRALVQLLKAGGLVGILCDQARKSEGTWVPFFGRPAWWPVGPAKLARLTGAALIVGGIRRVGWRRLEIVLRPPLDLGRAGAGPAGIQATTAEIARDLEGLVRESPSQWIWMYDPWRGAPVAAAETPARCGAGARG
jgi:KDO2-lipid IV(A) lauroyltransferase